MSEIRWNAEKSQILKKKRGISFEEIIHCPLIDVVKNPNRTHQKLLLYKYKNYIWAVPAVVTLEGTFLKTIYQSRKYTKIYLGGNQ